MELGIGVLRVHLGLKMSGEVRDDGEDRTVDRVHTCSQAHSVLDLILWDIPSGVPTSVARGTHLVSTTNGPGFLAMTCIRSATYYRRHQHCLKLQS